jgi:hypothetical protein
MNNKDSEHKKNQLHGKLLWQRRCMTSLLTDEVELRTMICINAFTPAKCVIERCRLIKKCIEASLYISLLLLSVNTYRLYTALYTLRAMACDA